MSPGSCTGTSTLTCTPGLYSSGLTIPNNVTVNFQAGGNYQFGGSVNCLGTPTSLCIQSGDSVNFSSVHYTFMNGIDVAGSGSTLCGSAIDQRRLSPCGRGRVLLRQEWPDQFGELLLLQHHRAVGHARAVSVPERSLWQDGGDNNQVVLAARTPVPPTLWRVRSMRPPRRSSSTATAATSPLRTSWRTRWLSAAPRSTT